MAQKPKTKRPASARSKNVVKAKAKKIKKTSLARRNYEYDHQYGLKLRGS